MHFLALSLVLAPTLASAKTISIAVGRDGLKFTPSTVTAAVGDRLDFHFYPRNHSVAASSFSKPCAPVQADGGLFSGFMPTTAENPSVFEVTVNSTSPIWIYCSQPTHCEGGMSMVVNQPSGGSDTLAAYQAAAKSVTAAQSPLRVAGGVFTTSNGTANGTSSASGSNTTQTSSSSTTAPSATGSAIAATPAPGEAGRTAVGMGMVGAVVAAFVAGMI